MGHIRVLPRASQPTTGAFRAEVTLEHGIERSPTLRIRAVHAGRSAGAFAQGRRAGRPPPESLRHPGLPRPPARPARRQGGADPRPVAEGRRHGRFPRQVHSRRAKRAWRRRPGVHQDRAAKGLRVRRTGKRADRRSEHKSRGRARCDAEFTPARDSDSACGVGNGARTLPRHV